MPGENTMEFCFVVCHPAEYDRNSARLCDGGREQGGIRIVDLATVQPATRSSQFAAGREDSHARSQVHRE